MKTIEWSVGRFHATKNLTRAVCNYREAHSKRCKREVSRTSCSRWCQSAFACRYQEFDLHARRATSHEKTFLTTNFRAKWTREYERNKQRGKICLWDAIHSKCFTIHSIVFMKSKNFCSMQHNCLEKMHVEHKQWRGPSYVIMIMNSRKFTKRRVR